MFGFRADGTQVKVDPISKIVPYIMVTRNDACQLARRDVECEGMDAFIKEQREKGLNFNYMHILIAAFVRTFVEKPKLNRFTIGGRIYQRNALQLSITLKESLNEDAPDITIKMRFTGQESIFEVKEKVDANIKQAFEDASKNNKSTGLASALTIVPHFMIRGVVGFIKLLDRWGLLPRSILDVSPFHTSIYLTNLKSIKGDAVYHHLYNFGTTGIFAAMGKEHMQPVVDLDGNIVTRKIMGLNFTLDERFCDGFYFLKAIRLIKSYIADPNKLSEHLDIDPIESKKERRKRLKKIAKEEKKKQKEAKKQNKKNSK